MLTQNGIYVFDGYSTTKLNLSIDNLIKMHKTKVFAVHIAMENIIWLVT